MKPILFLFIAALSYGQVSVDVTWFGATPNDATDDAAAISSAISYLPATGGTVLFPAGQYVVGARINVNKPRVTLYSYQGATLQAASGARLTEMLYVMPAAQNFSLSHVVFDGNRSQIGTSGSTCVALQSKSFRLENVEVRNCDFIGIGFWNEAESGELVRVHVHDNGSRAQGQGYGIHGYSSTPSTMRPTGILIRDSRIERNYNLQPNSSGFSRYGAAICADVYSLTVERTRIADNFNVGGQVVDCGPAPTKPRNWRFTDNVVELTASDIATTGGFEHNASGAIVSGNTFRNLYYGVAVSSHSSPVSGVSIEKNRFSEIVYYGVWLIGSQPPNRLRGTLLYGNSFSLVGAAIRFETGEEAGTRIVANDFTESIGPAYSGSGIDTKATINIP